MKDGFPLDAKNQESKPNEKILIEAFKQNWLHFRHVEKERLQFTYVYSILIIAILTLLARSGLNIFRDSDPYSCSLVGFTVLLSFLGYFFILRANYVLGKYIKKVERITSDFNLMDYMALPSDTGIWKILKVRYIFEMLYFITVIVWSAIFLYMIFGNTNFVIPVWVVLIILFAIILVILRIRLKNEENS
jgi:hypothetical protein